MNQPAPALPPEENDDPAAGRPPLSPLAETARPHSGHPAWNTEEQCAGIAADWLAYALDLRERERALQGGHFPEEGSSLYVDDQRTAPNQVSHRILARISVAGDHLAAFTASLGEDQFPYATFTLLRGAIENAATACWIAFPASESTRRARGLKIALAEAEDEESYVRANGGPPPGAGPGPTTGLSEQLELIDPKLNRERLTYTRMLKDVSAELEDQPGRTWWFEPTNCWRLCSGMAHGRRWAQLAMLSTGVVATTDHSNSTTMQFALNPKWLAWCVVHAAGLMDLALRRALQLGQREPMDPPPPD